MSKPDPKPRNGTKSPGGPALQGEGNYTAARRHRASVKKFIDQGKVEPAAEEAAPETEAQAEDLAAAERAGRDHARH